MIDHKGTATAETSNGGHSVLHVGADQVDVVNLHQTTISLLLHNPLYSQVGATNKQSDVLCSH